MEASLSCSPNQTKQNIIRCIKAGLVPFIQSSPGIGKSSIVRQIAEEFNLKLIDHRLSTSDPTDLLGLPHFENGKAVFSPFRDLFPLEDTPLPKGKDGFLLFLDEFNSAPRSIQAAAYKLILDRQIGQYKLHPRCAVVCAGNKLDDNAITVNLSTAMQSRLIHIIMEPNFNEWLENIAFKEDYDERIVSFLNMYPEYIMVFDPEHTEHTFACPRTLEFVNKLIRNEPEIDESWLALLSGTITSEIAMTFFTFCKMREEMISYSQVIANPDNAPIPAKNEVKWSTILHLLNHLDNEEIFTKVSKYVSRYPVDYKIIFYRAVNIKHPELKSSRAYTEARLDLASYFED